MTVDTLAAMTARQFSVVEKKIDVVEKKIDGVRNDLTQFATKEDLKHFATKEDLRDFATKDDLKASEVRILQAVDKIATAFDKAEKDHAADKLLHDRHEKRLERIEARVGLRAKG
jgi:hypothetical protein